MNGSVSMMKTLYILRHSKTNHESPTGRDFDRTLAERGVCDAELLGEFMSAIEPQPQLIISSSAVRARETTDAANLQVQAETRFEPRIYEASTSTLVDIVSEIPINVGCAMLVGHNPGFEGLVEYLTGEAIAMPTSALAIVESECEHWNSIPRHECTLRGFRTPKHGFVLFDKT